MEPSGLGTETGEEGTAGDSYYLYVYQLVPTGFCFKTCGHTQWLLRALVDH